MGMLQPLMTPRSLFNIILKVLGIFFIRDFPALIPPVLSVILLLSKPDGIVEAIWALGTSLLGGLIVADTIPTFCQQLFSYYQQKRMTYGLQNPEISYVVFSGVKILIGVLLLTNHRQITRFIEWKRKH